MSGQNEENVIKVVIRVRPSIPTDLSQEKCIQTRKNVILVTESGDDEYLLSYGLQPQTFQYDTVLGPESTQDDVFAQIKPVLDSFVSGENATCMCYGVTSSGKTYTMGLTGIIQRSAQYLESWMSTGIISCQLLEIYNEKLSDLLDPQNNEIKLSAGAAGQTQVCGASQYFIRSSQELHSLMKEAEQRRRTSATKFNEKSSRSHVIMILYLHDGRGVAKAKLCLADLAGCERLHADIRSQAGQETKHINVSLQTLGKVVHQLARRERFISYRDSTLTKLLSDSIGGNHRTIIVVCISPSILHRTETLNTLRFADRAKRIINKPAFQDEDDLNHLQGESLLIKLKEELERLQVELQDVMAQNSAVNHTPSRSSVPKYTESDVRALQERILRLEEILSLGGLVRLDTSSDKLSLQQNITFAREQLDRLLRDSSLEGDEMLFKYKKNVQSLEKFKLVINKQKENATYLLDCLNKLSGQYLQKCLELEAASRQRRSLLQQVRLQLVRESSMRPGSTVDGMSQNASEDTQIAFLEAQLSQLELKKFWHVQKLQGGRAYLQLLESQDADSLITEIQRQRALARLPAAERDQAAQYFKEQTALISLIKNRILPLLDTANTGALEILFGQIRDALHGQPTRALDH